jgi:hypothetical protein
MPATDAPVPATAAVVPPTAAAPVPASAPEIPPPVPPALEVIPPLPAATLAVPADPPEPAGPTSGFIPEFGDSEHADKHARPQNTKVFRAGDLRIDFTACTYVL